MELHPILDIGNAPNEGLWYVLSLLGEQPSVRVGHTLSYVPSPGGHSGRVYVIGGANPSGTFGETYILNLETFSWDTCDDPGLRPRYEHSAFTPASQPHHIYIFGGADQSGNHNDIQVYDTTTQSWSAVTPGGTPPSPRTYHNATASGDSFIVYSGGQTGADPVGDRQVHCYNANTNAWSTLNVRGDSPKPRHGHLVASVGNKVIIHGGMSGPTFYDDLHVLDLGRATWTRIKQKRVFPSARAAHSGVVLGSDLYVFGGMNRDGALDDLYKLDTVNYKWTHVALGGPPPACRLDMAMCVVRLRVPVNPPPVQETMAASIQAKDILDSQLRLSSAGSTHSTPGSGSVGTPSSAGSVRSISSLPGATIQDIVAEGVAINPSRDLSPTADDPSLCCLDNESATTDEEPHKLVDLALVFAGMDTEGEIFDDVLVYLLKEQTETDEAEGGSESIEHNGSLS